MLLKKENYQHSHRALLTSMTVAQELLHMFHIYIEELITGIIAAGFWADARPHVCVTQILVVLRKRNVKTGL